MRRLAPALIAFALAPAAAHADGLPMPYEESNANGVTAEHVRYHTLYAGRDRRIVARIDIGSGIVLHQRLIGRYVIPVVAMDGTNDGLSRDGHTLVLIRPRSGFPRKRTQLLVLSTGELRTQRRIVLKGDFSFDAISPDGETAFLIQYTSRRDPTRYKVRALDLGTGRLEPGEIVDPRNPDERMGGVPLARAWSPDGRWAYTLYDSPEHPFIHALDTEGRTAACIDLHGLSGLPPGRVDLRGSGPHIDLLIDGAVTRRVNATTFHVTTPRPTRRTPAPPPPEEGSSPALPIGGATLLVLLAAVLGLRRRRSKLAHVGPVLLERDAHDLGPAFRAVDEPGDDGTRGLVVTPDEHAGTRA